MEGWLLFSDPRFLVRFEYPGLVSEKEAVDRRETEQEGMLRILVLAPESQEVYFEVSKYPAVSPESAYLRHREHLENQFSPLKIKELKEARCGQLQAYEYSFEWDQGARTVLLVERPDATYRILYNPRSPINEQILSTVAWINLP